MHERFPTVERLQYHQQMVLFDDDDDDDVHEVATRSTIFRTVLTEWFKTNENRKLHEALHSINSLNNGCGIGS